MGMEFGQRHSTEGYVRCGAVRGIRTDGVRSRRHLGEGYQV